MTYKDGEEVLVLCTGTMVPGVVIHDGGDDGVLITTHTCGDKVHRGQTARHNVMPTYQAEYQAAIELLGEEYFA